MSDSVEQVVREYLTADATFTAKFEGIYWYEADSTTVPYLVYWQVDDSGIKSRLNAVRQGEARIQFDIWDSNKFRGVRLREDVKEKIEDINETRGGYSLYCIGTTETTVPRADEQEPYHFVVDAILKWFK
jgi:hypothetical protein